MKSQTLEIEDSELEPSEFSFAITRIAVVQICQSVGFKAAQRSALETLTDIATMYLQALAKSPASSVASTGCTQSNLFDIVHALEDLQSVQGFRGASDITQALYTSFTVVDIMKFVKYTNEIPFAKPMPRHFSSSRSIFSQRLVNLKCGNGGLNHIPRWLPAIPEMGDGKEGRKEEKWGFGSCGEDEGCLVGEKKGGGKRGKKMELPTKRTRVKFKMGQAGGEVGGEGFVVDLRSGVCRGGKRVSCQIGSGDED